MNGDSVHPYPYVCRSRRLLAVFLGVLFGAGLVLNGLAVLSARAQLMTLDEIPWFAPADSTSRLAMIAELGHQADGKFGWHTDRLLLTGILPAGERGAFFLRLPFVTFATGQTPLLNRWPWVRGLEADDDWPGEHTVSSIAQPEVGATGPLDLPGLGTCFYGLAMGLPVGTDRLYPVSSKSLPLRIEARKLLDAAPRTQVGLTLGYLMHMDSGDEVLDAAAAFPSGYHVGLALQHYLGPGSRWSLTWDYHDRDGRRSQLLGARAWIRWGDVGAWGLKVARELQGTLDRSAEWYVSLAWRFDQQADEE